MTKFAFYGRCSTEDQQDPASSKAWQLARSRSLIEPHGGRIVAEFFDIGQSRSLPWKRRPEANALLEALKRPDRTFDAIVVGEPARAFYGSQFAMTFPLLTHHDVELWVPEVGGRVDPGSDAHDMIMSLFGGMSKGERNRIKIRTRAAMSAQATQGRYLGGRVPYGYRLRDAGPHPNAGKAAAGQRLHQLEPDPTKAPIVRRIFEEYVGGKGFWAIAEDLTRDRVPSPSMDDPTRCRKREFGAGAWSKAGVRAILRNPRYTGYQLWGKQRRDEVLVDVEDVALGHRVERKWNPRSEWVWSAEPVHEPLISGELFARAQEIATAGARRPLESKRRKTSTGRRYLLSGLMRCGICGRMMQGNYNHNAPYYRCRFPSEYAGAAELGHPLTVYVREEKIIPELDKWLARMLEPKNIDRTLEALAAASEIDETAVARAEAARRKIADCDRRLSQYRKTLDAGGDPLTLATWMREVQGERLAAEQELGRNVPAEPLTKAELRKILKGVVEGVRMLAEADRDLKGRLYNELGVRLEYRPEEQKVVVEVPLQEASTTCATGSVPAATYSPTSLPRQYHRRRRA